MISAFELGEFLGIYIIPIILGWITGKYLWDKRKKKKQQEKVYTKE